MERRTHTLLSPSLGTRRVLASFHFGTPGQGEKAYLQASLHADELPGMLVLHHLKRLLVEAEQRGDIRGEVVLVPVANPVGLAQTVMYSGLGRFDLTSGENFNRKYPDFFALIGPDIEMQLGPDAAANRTVIRKRLGERLRSLEPDTELDSLRATLIGMAYDADVVLDLHCDSESVMHVYTEEPYWEGQGKLLARCLGARASLLARGSGGASFDEACSGVWWQLGEHLQARYGDRYPVPLACLSATVELRGECDVDHVTAAADAQRLFHFLQLRGIIAGPAAEPEELPWPATPLAGSESIKAPHPGVLAFLVQPGTWVEPGTPLVDVIDPMTETVTTLHSGTSGLMYARIRRRYATRGMSLCKIAGAVAFKTGNLLSP